MGLQILDGGMGTTLESLGHDTSGPMWGCDFVQSDPAAIAAVHDGFARAGADILMTATYQMTLPDLAQMGHDAAASRQILAKAIDLAAAAAAARGGNGKVALSLGPFGAALRPGQEYAGFYPPPYGPRAYTGDDGVAGGNTNFADGPKDAACEDALVEWHLARLRAAAATPGAWAKVAWLAFETIPVLREVRAIRRAVAALNAELPPAQVKPFWITSAFARGSHGQLSAAGSPVPAAAVVEAMYAPLSPDNAAATPAGLGINCTHPSLVAALAREFTDAVCAIRSGNPGLPAITFVLYPDGGSVWDPHTRTWASGNLPPGEWADTVLAVAHEADCATLAGTASLFNGVIVGGCCKSSFAEIGALRAAL